MITAQSVGKCQGISNPARLSTFLDTFSVIDPDAALVRRCKKGDTNAYRLLVERHESKVMSILARIMSTWATRGSGLSHGDVEDLAQEIFVQAWRALPAFRAEAKFSTWLYRIATNRALREWRRAQRAPGEGWSADEIDDERQGNGADFTRSSAAVCDPAVVLQNCARDEHLRSAIDALPEKQRAVVLLHYFEDYGCDEIAELLDCSVGTIWSRLHYACKKLRVVYSAEEQ